MKKEEMRIHFRTLRFSLSEERRRKAADAACQELLEALQPFKLISSFESMLGEIDLLRLNEQLRCEGRLVLPGSDMRLFHNREEVSPQEVDCFLVPGLAFHISGHRLGYGKGYYDRLLVEVSAPTWGIGFKEQEAERLPFEPHDIPLKRLLLF